MGRSRGAPSVTLIDQSYPHQVMLKNDGEHGRRLWEICDLAATLGAYRLRHNFYFEEEAAYYSVYCFSDKGRADAFLIAFSGEWLSPTDRKCRRWRPRSVLASDD